MRRTSLSLAALFSLLALIIAGSAGAEGSALGLGSNVAPSLARTIERHPDARSVHVIVFGSDLSRSDRAIGVRPRDSLSVIGAQSLTLSAARAAKLAAQPGVQYMAQDIPIRFDSAGSQNGGSVSSSSLATLYPKIDGATGLWANGVTGSGVGIAIIDSGVTPRADFGGRLVQVQLPTQDGTNLNDSVGHGSAVAGAAAGESTDGKYIGVAPGATVYAINIARADGVYTSDVIDGIEWVLQNAARDHIRVVNLSLSQDQPSSYLSDTLDAAVNMLWNEGIVVVCAAGNLGPNSEDYAPGNDPYAITVGAADADSLNSNNDTLASFSSYGTTPDGFQKPEIVAPGEHIWTTIPASSTIAQAAPAGYLLNGSDGTYVKISGTSFSTPQVAGAAALLLQENPGLTPNQVKWLLAESETPLSGSNAGMLDLSNITSSALWNPQSANKGLGVTQLVWGQNSCNGLYGGSGGQVDVSGGETCTLMPGTVVYGNVTVQQGGALNDLGATIFGNLQAQNASWVEIDGGGTIFGNLQIQGLTGSPVDNDDAVCNTTVYGNVQIQNDGSNAPTDLGDLGACAGRNGLTVEGNLEVQGNAGAVTVAGNTVSGNIQIDNETALVIAGANTAGGNIQIQGNSASVIVALNVAGGDSQIQSNAAAWDAAAWDAAAWDGAAWNAAAWDAAAWDAAAWDAAAWD